MEHTVYCNRAGLGEDRASGITLCVGAQSSHSQKRSVRKEKAVAKGVCHSCSPIRPVLCLFRGLAIEWGVGLLNELINVKNILMLCQEAPALLDESQAQF